MCASRFSSLPYTFVEKCLERFEEGPGYGVGKSPEKVKYLRQVNYSFISHHKKGESQDDLLSCYYLPQACI